MLSDLLDQIATDERINSVYADGVYDTKLSCQVIADQKAHTVIPLRKNAKPWKDQQAMSIEQNELLKTVKRLGKRSGKNGLVIIVEVWWTPRCIASNY